MIDRVPKQVRPDSKGRIALGKLAEGVSSFRVTLQPDGRLLLEPMVEIPAKELRKTAPPRDDLSSQDRYIRDARELVLDLVDRKRFAVFLFGSRADGTAVWSSDIDIGILGDARIDRRALAQIKDQLEDSRIPLKVDVVDFFDVDPSFRKKSLEKVVVWNQPKNIKLA